MSGGGDAFNHIYYLMIFIALIFMAGKIALRLGMPALVGEIVLGLLIGPNLLEFVHNSDYLIVIGEVGLVMLVVEAGLDVDVGMLKLIGGRGLTVAVLGSMVPLGAGTLFAVLMGYDTRSAIAIGACFAPTSMGIALNVLKKARILNTPTGQLIIAAAILDDVIALMLLSELQALKDPTVVKLLLPLIVSPILIIIFGGLALTLVPKVVKKFMNKVPKKQQENAILFLLFLMVFLCVPGCHYAGSSHLLGAFLAGLMFCTDHTIHHAWQHQIKRILGWMIRIFFTCTIGFAIPVKEFKSLKILLMSAVFMICILGKLVTGIWAPQLNTREFLIIGCSMSAWGEFAFILATASFADGTIDKDAFSAVLLAVLISVIIAPYGLKMTIAFFDKKKANDLDDRLLKHGGTGGHPVYWAIITKARGQWGHQDKLLHAIFSSKLEIIDFRSWHAPEYNYSHHQPLTKESFYVLDQQLIMPPTKYLNDNDKDKLKKRSSAFRANIKQVLGDEAIVQIKRWLPGVHKMDDRKGQNVKQMKIDPQYCRTLAFKQAHSIMSMTNLRDAESDSEEDSLKKGRINASDSDNDEKNRILTLNHMKKRTSFSMNELYEGPGKGAGALPITSKVINIHVHLDDGDDAYDSADSISYIYANEDANHHELPEYQQGYDYTKTNTDVEMGRDEQKEAKNKQFYSPPEDDDDDEEVVFGDTNRRSDGDGDGDDADITKLEQNVLRSIDSSHRPQ